MSRPTTPMEVGTAVARCRLGNGSECCSFLGWDKRWACLKNSDLAIVILERRLAGTMKAMGDHCSGPPEFKPNGQEESP
jgi:hypothetical protein